MAYITLLLLLALGKATLFFLRILHSLNETLKLFRRLTRPNALLFIEVPNIDYKKLPEGNHVPHTYCFSETSIVSVFKTFGFQLVNPNALEISDTGGLRALFQKIIGNDC